MRNFCIDVLSLCDIASVISTDLNCDFFILFEFKISRNTDFIGYLFLVKIILEY